jgi:hypothetical protein
LLARGVDFGYNYALAKVIWQEIWDFREQERNVAHLYNKLTAKEVKEGV